MNFFFDQNFDQKIEFPFFSPPKKNQIKRLEMWKNGCCLLLPEFGFFFLLVISSNKWCSLFHFKKWKIFFLNLIFVHYSHTHTHNVFAMFFDWLFIVRFHLACKWFMNFSGSYILYVWINWMNEWIEKIKISDIR